MGKVCANAHSVTSGQGSTHFNSSKTFNQHLPHLRDKQKSAVFTWKQKIGCMLESSLVNSRFIVWSNMEYLFL